MDPVERAKREGDTARDLQRQLIEARKVETETSQTPETPVDATNTSAVEPIEPSNERPERDISPAPPESKPQPESTPDDANSESWKHKYQTLQGMLASERRAANVKIEALERQVQGLVEKLANTPAEPQETTPVAPAKTPGLEIDPESFSEYGEEFQKLARMVNTLRQENDALRAEVGDIAPLRETVALTAKDRFLTHLGQVCPDYERLNTDQGFLAWLSQENPFDPAGRSRQECLTEAVSRYNADKAGVFFNAYLSENRGSSQAEPTRQPAPQPTNVQPSSRPRQTVPSGKRTFTRDEVQRFYRDVARGGYVGREAEALAIKRDIALASGEGRIR